MADDPSASSGPNDKDSSIELAANAAPASSSTAKPSKEHESTEKSTEKPSSDDKSAVVPNDDSAPTLPISNSLMMRSLRWVACVCRCSFDLDVGQICDQQYPENVLNEHDKKIVAFLSFPDNTMRDGDEIYSFRIRRSNVLPFAQSDIREHEFVYGVVFFRQQPDATIRRGSFQKSIVIITHLPFIQLFQKMIGIMGPKFFEKGPETLVEILEAIEKWPEPRPGLRLSLPFPGRTPIEFTVPQWLPFCRAQSRVPSWADPKTLLSPVNNKSLTSTNTDPDAISSAAAALAAAGSARGSATSSGLGSSRGGRICSSIVAAINTHAESKSGSGYAPGG